MTKYIVALSAVLLIFVGRHYLDEIYLFKIQDVDISLETIINLSVLVFLIGFTIKYKLYKKA